MRPRSPTSRPASAPRAPTLDWWWLGRWVLVLLLAWDQIGSPLHQHHHDSGVDGQWSVAPKAASGIDEQHIEDRDDLPRLSHATLAVRVQVVQAPVPPDSAGTTLIVQTWFAPGATSAIQSDHELKWSDERPPPGQAHLCLPPTGRAPPLHV